MEITIKFKVVLEVPEESHSKVSLFTMDATKAIRSQLFRLYAVRNVIEDK